MGILSRSLAFHVRKAQLALQRRGLRSMSAGGVGPAEFGTLVLCEQNPGLAQFQIAAALDIDKASVVAVVDRLEELGWVVRRRSSQDRRRYGLFLTPSGAQQTELLRQQAAAGGVLRAGAVLRGGTAAAADPAGAAGLIEAVFQGQ